MPSKKNIAADEADSVDVSTDEAATTVLATDAPVESSTPAGVSAPAQSAPPVETGEALTETRTFLARNSSATLLSLEDGTHFPPKRKKWLTASEADRFKRMNVIVILN